tara:strand:+ start:105 stop:323 length:219 start_codon:yes stop_codon:yes gene_type:complete
MVENERRAHLVINCSKCGVPFTFERGVILSSDKTQLTAQIEPSPETKQQESHPVPTIQEDSPLFSPEDYEDV